MKKIVGYGICFILACLILSVSLSASKSTTEYEKNDSLPIHTTNPEIHIQTDAMESPQETMPSTTEVSTVTKTDVTTPVPQATIPVPSEPVVETKPKPIVQTPTSKPVVVTPTVPVNSKPKWGVFAGSNPTVIKDFEQRIDENPDYLAYFVHWGNDNGKLPNYLKDLVYKKDRTLVLFWEASDYKIGGTDQPYYSYSSMLEGNWDDYFRDFANQLSDYEGPVILVPFSELNGNWTPWSGTKNGNTPAEAVLAYRYIHGFFTEAQNVSFGWAVNAPSVPNTDENKIENYYPGDAYVDYVGVDGFNMGTPWLSFDTIFAKALATLSKYNKPTLLFSFATAEGAQKAEWLDDALNVQLPKYPFVTGWVYFNQHKERNWLLWSDEETFDVFNSYITK